MAVEHKYKHITCSYVLTPDLLDNHYQCYDEDDEDDDDITIITSNLGRNKNGNSDEIDPGIKATYMSS